MNDYLTALAMKDELDKLVNETSGALNAFPKGPMGLTLDSIKATPEWDAAYKAYHNATNRARKFNQVFVKAFKKEYLKTIAERRANR